MIWSITCSTGARSSVKTERPRESAKGQRSAAGTTLAAPASALAPAVGGVGRGDVLAHAHRGDVRDLAQHRVLDRRQVGPELGHVAGPGGAHDDAVDGGGDVDHEDVGVDRLHRPGQDVDQAVVALGAPGVDRRHPARLQVLFHLGEELAGGEVEGDVRLAVGVHGDHPVALGGLAQEVAGVLGDRRQVGHGHVEEAPPDLDDAGVDLHPVYGHRAEDLGVLPGGRPRGAPQQEQAIHVRLPRPGLEEGGHQEVVPGAAGDQGGGVVDGVHRLPLVEDQVGTGAVLHHLDVVVGRLRLVQQVAIGLGPDHLPRDQPQPQNHHQRGDVGPDQGPGAPRGGRALRRALAAARARSWISPTMETVSRITEKMTKVRSVPTVGIRSSTGR